MEDGHQIAIGDALKVLVARSKAVQREPLQGLGEKSDRLHFRVDRLREVFSKSQPEDKRAEVVERGNTTEIVREDGLAIQLDVLASLLQSGAGNAPVHHAEIITVDIG